MFVAALVDASAAAKSSRKRTSFLVEKHRKNAPKTGSDELSERRWHFFALGTDFGSILAASGHLWTLPGDLLAPQGGPWGVPGRPQGGPGGLLGLPGGLPGASQGGLWRSWGAPGGPEECLGAHGVDLGSILVDLGTYVGRF